MISDPPSDVGSVHLISMSCSDTDVTFRVFGGPGLSEEINLIINDN